MILVHKFPFPSHALSFLIPYFLSFKKLLSLHLFIVSNFIMIIIPWGWRSSLLHFHRHFRFRFFLSYFFFILYFSHPSFQFILHLLEHISRFFPVLFGKIIEIGNFSTFTQCFIRNYLPLINIFDYIRQALLRSIVYLLVNFVDFIRFFLFKD